MQKPVVTTQEVHVQDGGLVPLTEGVTTEIQQLLREAAQGSAKAADELLPLVYDDLRGLAGHFMRGERANHTLQPTALVHEAYLRLMRSANIPWESRAQFLAVAARAMRQVLIEHARRYHAAKRGGKGPERLTLVQPPAADQADQREAIVDILALDDALNELEHLHARHAKVVELRFFGGLTIPEAAHALGVSVATVQNDWAMARVWLGNRLHP